MKKLLFFLIFILIELINSFSSSQTKPIRILVVTGGHDYNVEQFNKMLVSLGTDIQYLVVELPSAYDMFLPENRDKYDVLVFFHMWQELTEDQAHTLENGIREAKSLVVLHHSICAYDDWPEYTK